MNKTMMNVMGAMATALLLNSGAWAADQVDNQYKSTVKDAEAQYDAAKEQCKQLEGNQKDVCIENAKAQYTKTKADAKVQRKSGEAAKDANADKRDADYKAATEKCDDMTGSAKDACVQRAKTTYHQ
jgi:hypothetical protein